MNGEEKYIPYLKMMTNIWSYSSFLIGKLILLPSPQPHVEYEKHLVISWQRREYGKENHSHSTLEKLGKYFTQVIHQLNDKLSQLSNDMT